MMSGRAAEVDPKFAGIFIDVNYWTGALRITTICKAKAFLGKQFKILAQTLKAEREAIKTSTAKFDSSLESSADSKALAGWSSKSIPAKTETQIEDADIPMIDAEHALFAVYSAKAIDSEDDYEELEGLRMKVLRQSMEKLQKQALFNQKQPKKLPIKKKKESNTNTNSAPKTKMEEVKVDKER